MPVQAPFGITAYPEGMNYSLDQVRAFIAVAEERHFGRAADRLAMTQPPLSRAIQKLERAVGASLLDRDSRGVRVTGAGEAFLAECYRLVALVDSAGDLARRVDAGAAGVVRIGFTAVSAIGMLGPLLAQLEEELPDVRVVLREGVTGVQVEALRRGELDLGLARPPFDTDFVGSRLMVREELRAVVPTGHPLSRLGRPLVSTDFDGVPVIAYDPVQSRYFHELAVHVLLNAHPRVEQQVHQVLTAMLLVAAGRGVALAPASARHLGIAGVEFVALRMPAGDELPVELHAIWPRAEPTPLIRRVVRVLARVAERLELGDG